MIPGARTCWNNCQWLHDDSSNRQRSQNRNSFHDRLPRAMRAVASIRLRLLSMHAGGSRGANPRFKREQSGWKKRPVPELGSWVGLNKAAQIGPRTEAANRGGLGKSVNGAGFSWYFLESGHQTLAMRSSDLPRPRLCSVYCGLKLFESICRPEMSFRV